MVKWRNITKAKSPIMVNFQDPQMNPQLNIVTALSCEATPIVNLLQLKKLPVNCPFQIFSNRKNINLIVSGIGKTFSSAATAYLAALAKPNTVNSWLNVGIAGHSKIDVGRSLLANKLVDRSSGSTYYPALLIDYPCITSKLITVDRPETNYDENAAYDMEASGFFATAARFSTLELIQVLKIVSDNPDSSVGEINKQAILQWINSCSETIASIVDELLKLCTEIDSIYGLPVIYHKLLCRFHFSQTQKSQLIALTRRYHALGILNRLD